MHDDPEILEEFLVECHEGLDQLDRDLVALEEHPTDSELLGRIFRSIHTVKGTSGFLAFTQLERVTHVGENLLSQLRDGKVAVNAEVISALLATIDAVRELLQSIEATGAEHQADNEALIKHLTRLQNAVSSSSETEEATAAVGTPPPQAAEAASAAPLSAVPPVAKAALATAEPTQVSVSSEAPAPTGAPQPNSETGGAQIAANHIRVDVRLLDKLMNLVGELVLARNQIVQFTQIQEEPTFIAASHRLNLVTTELQEGIMQTRMQPIGTVWSKFPRVVRDLAVMCGKQVQISMEGKETELDKTLIEAIKDPLTHAVRNAIDHGIESPEARVAAGKPAEGVLSLRAFHEGGQVNIEISDDGAGINCSKVRERAVERGLVSYEEAQVMSERESIALLFRPGFSTAAAVTNVSGRGVGMDVVKTSIEKIGGSVDLQSVAGQGATLKIKIPLTLAIVPALLVNSGGECYAIPQISLLELVRLEGGQADKKVESIHGTPVYRLRGQLLPLVSLSEQLELEPAAIPDDGGELVLNIVVLQADDRQFGLIVDAINDTEEIVVKPLSEQLKGQRAFAGATILGDGKVALILDVLGLAEKSGVISDVRDRRHSEQKTNKDQQGNSPESLLLFGVGDKGRMALPLSQVERLEEFSPNALEKSGDFHVVQYRGEVMPLIHVSQVAATATAAVEHDGPLHVVVYAHDGRRIGLVVDKILDIVEVVLNKQPATGTGGLLGSVVVEDKVTDVLNVDAILGDGRICAPTLLGTQYV